MTDRIRTLTVMLDEDMPDGYELRAVVNAISLIKGVQEVVLGEPVDPLAWVARSNAHWAWREKLMKLIDEGV